MNLKKILAALLFIAIGFAICFFIFSVKEEANLQPTSYKTEFRNMEPDKLNYVIDTAQSVLVEKNSLTEDTIIQLGKIKDSLLVIRGKLEATLRFEKDTSLRRQLFATLDKVENLILATREIILNRALELLRPTNTSLRSMLKEMQEQTTKLQSIGHNIEAISEIVTSITNVISLPIFKPVSATSAL